MTDNKRTSDGFLIKFWPIIQSFLAMSLAGIIFYGVAQEKFSGNEKEHGRFEKVFDNFDARIRSVESAVPVLNDIRAELVEIRREMRRQR